MPPKLTDELREEYQRLFDTCVIRTARAAAVDTIVAALDRNRNRYAAVADPMRLPWFVVAVIHNMESSLDFNTHLHNGDPLTGRTTRRPRGRPAKGSPPFTWEESAIDALELKDFHRATDGSLPAMLYRLEAYNGWGYRSRNINTPYLWSFSNHYSRGKFVADGKFSAKTVSRQCGAAVLLRRMSELGLIQFTHEPLVRFSLTDYSKEAALLQTQLNAFPGVFLKVDGIPGYRTSDALRRVTGRYLIGDPRG